MKKLNLFVSLLISLIVLVSFSGVAQAKDFAVIDLSKVIENYNQAQEVTADLKVKESELQNFVMKAKKQIEEAKTPLEKQNLEAKLGEQFNLKKNAFAKEQSEQWQVVEKEVLASIEKFSKDKKFDMVFNKPSVIVGGVDITNDIIKKLNKK